MILCQSREGSCAGSQVGMAEFLMFVYILLEKEALVLFFYSLSFGLMVLIVRNLVLSLIEGWIPIQP